MKSLDAFFKEKPFKSRFIPYISLGDPDYQLSVRWAKAILDGGADILELGIPFSDPVADGPTIQKSYMRSLKNGFSVDRIFETTKAIHALSPSTPLVYLSYLNPIISYGVEKFFTSASENGIKGIVIPDLPFDTKETKSILEIADRKDICIIFLVTPASPSVRITELKKYASGFIYYVTSYGVTGARSSFADDLKARIERVREELNLPVCAGFGISNAEQAGEIAHYADGIIIGSAIQKIIEENGNNPDLCHHKLWEFTSQIVGTVH